MSEIFRITKLNDVLKFQISKMRLTPAEKGSKILNCGQKSENVVSLNVKIEKSSWKKNVWNVKLNDMLKFQIPKMRLTPAEKGSNISNFGQKRAKIYLHLN